MRGRYILLTLAALTPACDRPSEGTEAPTASAAKSAQAEAGGCAAALTADLDRQSFSAAGIGAGQAELGRWQRESAAAFKAAAASLCNQGKLAPADLAPFKQLLIQYGGGADSAAIWVDDARPASIILQYAFYPGEAAPSAEEAGAALACWNDPDTPACQERLP